MVKDPDFVGDIQKLNVELEPLPGERVQELIVRTLTQPPNGALSQSPTSSPLTMSFWSQRPPEA